MQKPNEVLTHSSLPEFTPLSKFPYISAAVLSKPEISKSLEENCTTTGTVSQLRQPLPIWDENTLIAIAEQQARGLSETLDRLKVYNENVVHLIASIIEPYLEAGQEIDFSIDLQPSIKFIAEVKRIEELEPEFYFE